MMTLSQMLSEHESIYVAHEKIEAKKKLFNIYDALTTEKMDRYSELGTKILEAAKTLKSEEITLFHHSFSLTKTKDFHFYYGQKTGQARLIPISKVVVGYIQGKSNWPLKNPETDEYFVPVIEKNVTVAPETLFTTTKEYLERAIDLAKKFTDSREYQILQALPPYAQKIQDAVDARHYNTLVELFPSQYPTITT